MAKQSWFDKLFNGPVSFEFMDEEELARRKRVRRQKIDQTVKKVTTVAKEGLNIYYQMRNKTPISVGLATLSAYGAVSEHVFERQVVEPNILLKDMGYKLVAQNTVASFVKKIYDQMEIPMKIYWKSSGDQTAIIEEYSVRGIKVFFVNQVSSEYVEGPFVKEQNDFYTKTSEIIEEKIGKYLILDTESDVNSGGPWSRNLCVQSIDIHKDAFVSPLDEEKLIEEINKFFKRGLNRSLLFYGSPGSGKTTLALRLAESLGGKILILNGWSLAHKSLGSIFNAINIIDPSIILFDDLDRFHFMETLLGDLERMNRDTSRRKRLYIATVNNLEAIPEALKRPGRFDQMIEFNAHINLEVCKNIIRAHADRINLTLSNDEVNRLASLSEGLTGAYLKEIVHRVDVLGMGNIEEHVRKMRALITCEEEEEIYEEDGPSILKVGSKRRYK